MEEHFVVKIGIVDHILKVSDIIAVFFVLVKFISIVLNHFLFESLQIHFCVRIRTQDVEYLLDFLFI